MFRTDNDKLKAQLTAKGKNIDDLASFIGVDRSTIYRRLQGNSLHISDMQKIAELLNLTGAEACEIFLVEQSQ